MARGKLIVFESTSGTGKETQAKLLLKYLSDRGIKSRVVYHPSPELKEILSQWRKTRNIDHISEAYFLLADRANRVEGVINPALGRGEWVISLRSWISALVYQAKTASDRRHFTKEFSSFEPKPDLLFFFDLTPEAALARVMKRHSETGEALGKFETPDLLRQKADAYQSVLKHIPHITIDASQSIEKIHQDITSHLSSLKAGP